MKPLNNIKWFTLGIVVCLLVSIFVVPALAAFTKTAELYYDNIKINLNGETLTPKDVNGKIVEPFIIDGTTYLPVRAIGESLGLGVDWDSATSTAILTGNSSTDIRWSKYNDAYPFLFLHGSADMLESIYGTISDYRNLVYIMYGRVANGQLSASEYADYNNTVTNAMKVIYNTLVSRMNYVESLIGAHGSSEYLALHKKAQLGYENLFFSFFSLEAMVQAVKDCRAGKPGSAAIIDEGDRSVGNYLTIALSNIEGARDGSLNYLINSLPDN